MRDVVAHIPVKPVFASCISWAIGNSGLEASAAYISLLNNRWLQCVRMQVMKKIDMYK